MKRIARRRSTGDVIVPTDPNINLGPFAGFKGINIMWPFLGPMVNNPNDLNTTYQANPFTNPSDFVSHGSSSRLNELVTLGLTTCRQL